MGANNTCDFIDHIPIDKPKPGTEIVAGIFIRATIVAEFRSTAEAFDSAFNQLVLNADPNLDHRIAFYTIEEWNRIEGRYTFGKPV